MSFSQPSSCPGKNENSFTRKQREVTNSFKEDRPPAEVRQSTTCNARISQKSAMLRSQYTVSNLLAIGGDRSHDPKAWKVDVDSTRRRLRSIARRTIDPHSQFVRGWDVVIMLALLFTCFVTPFEVAFFTRADGSYDSGPVNFALNRLVDTVFCLDLVINFFLPYRAPHNEGSMLVFDNAKIARHYLRGWFAIDFLTCIPFDIILEAAGTAAEGGESLRFIRMLRIMKLARIVRASRIFNRWQDHINVSFAILSLLRFTFLIFALAHWLACAWGFAGRPAGGEQWSDGRVGEWRGFDSGDTWRQKAGIPDTAGAFDLYGISLYVALNNIFGGACEINPANYAEFYVMSAMLLVGSSVWAYVIGSACGIVATLDPARIEYRQTMDELNHFCSTHCLPRDLVVKLRAYFRNTIHFVRVMRYDSLLKKMSTRLRGDAAFHMSQYQLRHVPFLVHPDLEPEFMCNLAIRFHTCVYSRLERVPCTDLFIVERGVVAKRGRLGLKGACFGKDVILSNDNLRDLGDAIALTFMQTITLTQADIFELLPDFPKAYIVVRKAALRMAMVSALGMAAQMIKRQQQRLGGEAVSLAGSITDVFDRALEEAANASVAKQREADSHKQQRLPMSLVNLSATLTRQRKCSRGASAHAKPKSRLWNVASRGLHAGAFKHTELSGFEQALQQRHEPTVDERLVALRSRLEDSCSDMRALSSRVDANHAAVMEALDAMRGSVLMRANNKRARQRMQQGPPQLQQAGGGTDGESANGSYAEGSSTVNGTHVVPAAVVAGVADPAILAAAGTAAAAGPRYGSLANHAPPQRMRSRAADPVSTGSLMSLSSEWDDDDRRELREEGAGEPSFSTPFEA